ncbi:MAG: formate dehydrogenase accessory sulfurtransferase FdhD [Marinicellaceae bacterium]
MNKHTHKEIDFVAVEKPLEIRLGHLTDTYHSLAITMCSPEDIGDLIYGYLFTEKIITHSSDILGIQTYDNELGLVSEVKLDKSIAYKSFLNKRNGMVHASCGVCGKTEIDDLLTYNYPSFQSKHKNIPTKIIQSLPGKLNNHQQAFTKTGGLHASALFDTNGELMAVKEDIGRHNALDKLIGYALKHQLMPLSNTIVLLSGRVSFELVHKSLMAGVKTIVAIGAPSSLSLEVAKFNELEIYGFVKATSYNHY